MTRDTFYILMGLKSQKILRISVTTSPKKEILELINKYLISGPKTHHASRITHQRPLVIVTPNPEQIVLAQKDPHFAQILNQADVAVPDGIGLALALRILGFPHSPITRHSSLVRIPGVELMDDLVELAAERGYLIGLIGGRAGVAVDALECLKRKYPGLSGWAEEPGEINIGNLSTLGDLGDLRDKIQKTHTRLVFVGLGAPKQEFFIEEMAKTHKPSSHPAIQPLVFMSVGGSFDIIAGRTPRAPFLLRTIGIEWLWRLVREPWRWRRQLVLLKFLRLVLWEKLAS